MTRAATVTPRQNKLSKEAAHWRDVCRNKMRQHMFKVASPTADDETPFEQALANLAHATLRDKAPGLLDFELGFQLVEKNEDNDKAVGVFGFKVGPQILYAPVFFINGELKGHELLYLKSSDTFVPMSEGWVNYLLARKPLVLGENISNSDTSRQARKPDLRMLRQSPAFKFGAAEDRWFDEALPVLEYSRQYHALPAYEPALPKLIEKNSSCAVSLVKMWDAYPHSMRPFVECYGEDFVKMAMDSAKAFYSVAPREEKIAREHAPTTGSVWETRREKRAFDPTWGGKLQIHTYSGDLPEGLTDDEKSQLLLDRVLIKDAREKTSEVFDNVLRPMSLTNPGETGLYSILTKPGDFTRCFVAMAPRKSWGTPKAVVVKVDGKNWTSRHSVKLWAEEQESREDYEKWYEELPSAKSISESGTYLLIGPGGQTVGPFHTYETQPSAEGEVCRKVSFTGGSCCDDIGPEHHYARKGLDSYADRSEVRAISVGKIGGSKVIERSGIYYIPGSWKALKLKEFSYDDDEGFRLGDMVDVHLGIIQKTAELKVWADGIEAEINGRRMPKLAAKLHLIREHGMREKTAEAVLESAIKSRGGRFRVKYAYPDTMTAVEGSPYDEYGGGFYSPQFPEMESQMDSFMGSSYPMQTTQEDSIAIPSAYPQDERSMAEPPTPDPDMMNQIMQASQTGQKEVLDTSAMSAMLRTQRSENLIDQYLGDVLRGLDRIGRLLFNFYWKNETFAERYGDEELKEIEDLLRSAFENTGDLVLRLRQETIEPFPGEPLAMGKGEFLEA